MSQPPKVRSVSSARGTNFLMSGERASVRLPRRMVPICVSDPTGCDLPLRTSSTPGMGAVSTTFMAGVELVRKGKSQPVGSLTQMGTIRLGKRTDARSPLIKKFVPLAELTDLAFGGWDIFKDNAYQSAANAGVLNPQDLEKVKPFLSTIKPIKAAFDHDFVKLIDGPNIKNGKNKYALALQIKEDIADFRKTSRA